MIKFIENDRYWSKSLGKVVLFVSFTGSGQAIMIDEETKEKHTVSITDLTKI